MVDVPSGSTITVVTICIEYYMSLIMPVRHIYIRRQTARVRPAGCRQTEDHNWKTTTPQFFNWENKTVIQTYSFVSTTHALTSWLY